MQASSGSPAARSRIGAAHKLVETHFDLKKKLSEMGVRRVSVGGSFALAAYGAVVRAGRELLDDGTYGFHELSAVGAEAARAAFG